MTIPQNIINLAADYLAPGADGWSRQVAGDQLRAIRDHIDNVLNDMPGSPPPRCRPGIEETKYGV